MVLKQTIIFLLSIWEPLWERYDNDDVFQTLQPFNVPRKEWIIHNVPLSTLGKIFQPYVC